MIYEKKSGEKVNIIFPNIKNAIISWKEIQLNLKDGSVIKLKKEDFLWSTWHYLVVDVKSFFGVEEKL